MFGLFFATEISGKRPEAEQQDQSGGNAGKVDESVGKGGSPAGRKMLDPFVQKRCAKSQEQDRDFRERNAAG